MTTIKFTLLGVFTSLLLNLTSFAQTGADPAVTNRNLVPAPLAGVGAPFSLTFTIGNNGAAPISGIGDGNANRMQFGVCLGKSLPNPLPTSPTDVSGSLSGPILNYFDVTYNPANNCFEGKQKQNVVIEATSVYNLEIAAVVTQASTNTAINDIGASCNIAPNGTANPQPTDNDFASIYTHTTTVALPVSLVSFTAQVQENRTALVNWSTSWERDNQSYLVERSKDLKLFEKVGEVNEVTSNSTALKSYRLVDQTPYLGTSYYRLTQTDLNGKTTAYPTVSIIIRDEAYGIFPNPVVSNGRFTLRLDEPETATIRLYSVDGRPLLLQKMGIHSGDLLLRPVGSLSAGVYLLTVVERARTRRHRLVVE